jgi:hypothetical protein
MSNVLAAFKRTDKWEPEPLVLTVGHETVFIDVLWDRTHRQEVHLVVKARENVDVLIPSTFKKLKARIKELEYQLELIRCSQNPPQK